MSGDCRRSEAEPEGVRSINLFGLTVEAKGEMMQGYWLTFTDGTRGYCEGGGAYDAVQIAEKLTGKTVVAGDNKYQPKLDMLPYPATPVIWQLDHPVHGKCPPFCYKPDQCKGNTACPQNYSCTE
jgi:hypothetical protein